MIAVLGEEERDWVDNIMDTAAKAIQDKFDLNDDSFVVEIMKDSLERIAEEL